MENLNYALNATHDGVSYPYWINGIFKLDLSSLPDRVSVSGYDTRAYANIFTDHPAFQDIFNQVKGGKLGYSQFMGLLERNSNASTASKLHFLAVFMDWLRNGFYNLAKDQPSLTPRQVYNAAQANKQGQAGKCGDIHGLGVEMGKKMGLACGQTSVITDRSSATFNQPDIGDNHAIAYCQDPGTKRVYLINYASVIDTGQVSLPDALQLSQRIFSPLNTIFNVESRPGIVRTIPSAIGAWTISQIEQQAFPHSDSAAINFVVSNREQTLGVDLIAHGDNKGDFLKSFFIGSHYSGSDGDYELAAAGFAGGFTKDFTINSKLLKEIGIAGNGYFGVLGVSVPALNIKAGGADANDESLKKTGLFEGVSIKGVARFNETLDGKVSLYYTAVDAAGPGMTADASAPYHHVDLGLNYAPTNSAVSASYEHSMQLTHDRMNGHSYNRLYTRFDKINVAIDSRRFTKNVYIVSGTDVYVLDGVENLSAFGIYEKLKLAYDAGKIGEFMILADLSAVLNHSKDPYFDLPPSASARVGYSKMLKQVEFKAEVGIAKNRPFPFLVLHDPAIDPSSAVPDVVPPASLRFEGYVWMKVHYK